MTVPSRAFLIGLASVLTLGCGRCTRSPSADGRGLTAQLPKEAEWVLVVPKVSTLGKKLKQLEGLKAASFIAQLQGQADASALAQQVADQLGFDVRSEESLARAGVDPDGPLGLVFLSEGRVYLVLPAKDATKLSAAVGRLSRKLTGAGEARTEEVEGGRVTGFSQQGKDGPVEMVMVERGPFVWVGRGPLRDTLLAHSRMPRELSLSSDATLKTSMGRLPALRDVELYVPQTSGLLRDRKVPGATATIFLDARELLFRADLPWPHNRGSLEMLRAKSGADLFGLLPPDAFWTVRFSGPPSALADVWPRLAGPRLARAAADAKFDVRAQVLDNLEDGQLAAISLAPEVRLSGGLPSFDLQRTNPFRFFHLSAVGRVKDPAQAKAALERIAEVAPSHGVSIARAERAGGPVYLSSYAQGEAAHFGLVQNTVVVASPESRWVELAQRVGAPGTPSMSADDRAFLEAHALGAVLDLRVFARSLEALPTAAWGLGGFAIKATASRWLHATDDLQSIGVGLQGQETSVHATLRLRFIGT